MDICGLALGKVNSETRIFDLVRFSFGVAPNPERITDVTWGIPVLSLK